MERFENILVVAREDSDEDAIMARARRLAQSNGASVTILHVIDRRRGDASRLLSVLQGHRARAIGSEFEAFQKDRVDMLAAPLRADGIEVTTHVASGFGFIETIRHVLRNGNDLVLKSAENTPFQRVLKGPDLHLLRKCPCPVWILNSSQEPQARRIAAAVDPDPQNPQSAELDHRVMTLATALGRQDSAKVDVLHAWYLHEEAALRHSRANVSEEEIDTLMSQIERDSVARANTLAAEYADFSDIMRIVTVKGLPEDVIAEHVENERIDTLVMGTVGRSGLAGFFIGNTAETVLNRVECSILAVKPEGFVTPVTLDEGATS